MKHSLPLLFVVLLSCLTIKNADGQNDSTFSVIRNSTEAKFPYLKFSKPEQLRSVSATSLPLYSFNKVQFSRIKGLLSEYAQLEGDYRALLTNRNLQDSIRSNKEKTLADELKLQEERTNNFKASYNSLLNVNLQLNEQLKKAEQLAIHEHKKNKLKLILFGVVTFSTGTVIGMAVK